MTTLKFPIQLFSSFLLPILFSQLSDAAIIQAEDYSAFYDTTPGNIGGAYRADDVDIESTQDQGGGFNVGWIEPSEWLAYSNIAFARSGNYTIRLRVASATGGGVASVDLNAGSTVLGTVDIPNTGGWQNWRTVSFSTFVNAGTYNLGLYAAAGAWNINWIEVISEDTPSAATVWQHCDYRGWSVRLSEGRYSRNDLIARGVIDNSASSMQLAPGYEAVVFDGANFNGASVVYRASDNCMVNENLNDRMSSLIIRQASTGGNGDTWRDDFDSIDSSNWSFETGGGGWGNNELQYYTNGANASIQYDSQVDSNVLVIEARRESGFNCWYGPCQYTSTRMITRGKREFRYGRIEARIKLTQTQGGWPAFWMLGSNIGTVGWPACGEIDIMEHVNNAGNIHGTIHWQDQNGNYASYGGDTRANVTGYHIYAVERDSNEIRWYFDGNLYHRVDIAGGKNGTSEFHNPHFILMNFAVGGNWPGSPDGSSRFPQRMYVDYVRYTR